MNKIPMKALNRAQLLTALFDRVDRLDLDAEYSTHLKLSLSLTKTEVLREIHAFEAVVAQVGHEQAVRRFGL